MPTTPHSQIDHFQLNGNPEVAINDAFDDLDEATNGYYATATADADLNLATTLDGDGDSVALRNRIFEFTGTLTAGRTITLPDAERLYHVWNNTSGGFDLTFRTVTGSATAVVTMAKWATLTIDDSFDVRAVTADSELPLGAGSEATPSLAFTGDLDTGMWSPGADTIAWSVGADEYLRLTGTRLVVGGLNGSPDGTLHVHTASAGVVAAAVSADDLVVEGSGDTGLTILAGNANLARLGFGDDGANLAGDLTYDHVADTLTLAVGGSARLIADATDVTMAAVDIDGGAIDGTTIGAASAAAGSFTSFTSNGIDDNATTEQLQIADAVIHANQNVLVGDLTTTPDGTLHVHTAAAGGVAAHANGDDFIVENSGNTGMSLLSPDANLSQILFGSPSNNIHSQIQGQYNSGTPKLNFATAGNTDMTISNKIVYIGDDINGKMTIGLTINIGANDDQAFCLKSSDVSTGLTTAPIQTDVEIDDFFTIAKRVPATGGAILQALMDDGSNATCLDIQAYGGLAETSNTSTSVGLINIFAAEHNGSNSLVNAPTNTNLLTIQSQSGGGRTTRLLLKGDDGELHLGNTTLVALDDHDDAELVRSYEVYRTRGQVVEDYWEMRVETDYEKLVDAGILAEVSPKEWKEGVRPLWCVTRHIHLLDGFANQQAMQHRILENVIAERFPEIHTEYRRRLDVVGMSHVGVPLLEMN